MTLIDYSGFRECTLSENQRCRKAITDEMARQYLLLLSNFKFSFYLSLLAVMLINVVPLSQPI